MRHLLAAFLLLAACGGDDRPEPIKSCERLANAWCGRADQCFGWSQAQRAECVQLFTARLACERAAEVMQPAYSECLSKIPSWSCDQVRNARLPAECTGVIRWPDGMGAP